MDDSDARYHSFPSAEPDHPNQPHVPVISHISTSRNSADSHNSYRWLRQFPRADAGILSIHPSRRRQARAQFIDRTHRQSLRPVVLESGFGCLRQRVHVHPAIHRAGWSAVHRVSNRNLDQQNGDIGSSISGPAMTTTSRMHCPASVIRCKRSQTKKPTVTAEERNEPS